MGRKLIDLVGQEFGRLTVISFAGRIGKRTMWDCRCICGKETVVSSSNLRQGTRSCGCLNSEAIDIVGQEFGDLLVESRAENKKKQICWNCECICGKKTVICGANLKNGHTKSCGCSRIVNMVDLEFGYYTVASFSHLKRTAYWNCVCKCGTKKIVRGAFLRNGSITSCGCYNLELITTHGMTNTPEFRAWNSMKNRCSNQTVSNYHLYGGRGITVCESWQDSFENFYADMGKRPEGMTLERIDVNGNYCKENCKWATQHEQSCNKRNSREIIGVQLRSSGNYQWTTRKKGKIFSGTCKTKELAAAAYDDKNEEFGRGRPNKTERKK